MLQDLWVDQVVVEHHVGPSQAVAATKGQQARVARSGPNQIDAAGQLIGRKTHEGACTKKHDSHGSADVRLSRTIAGGRKRRAITPPAKLSRRAQLVH